MRKRWEPRACYELSRPPRKFITGSSCYGCGSTSTSTPLAALFWRKTCSVAFWNSSCRALGMSVKVCGLRSVNGNQELST